MKQIGAFSMENINLDFFFMNERAFVSLIGKEVLHFPQIHIKRQWTCEGALFIIKRESKHYL